MELRDSSKIQLDEKSVLDAIGLYLTQEIMPKPGRHVIVTSVSKVSEYGRVAFDIAFVFKFGGTAEEPEDEPENAS